jgi:hypothetical protein
VSHGSQCFSAKWGICQASLTGQAAIVARSREDTEQPGIGLGVQKQLQKKARTQAQPRELRTQSVGHETAEEWDLEITHCQSRGLCLSSKTTA